MDGEAILSAFSVVLVLPLPQGQLSGQEESSS